MGRILAVDYGEKRIGVAVTDEDQILAQPLQAVEAEEGKALEPIMKLIDEYQAEAVVVGLPIGLSGQATKQTDKVRRFAEELQKISSKPVHLADERFTTAQILTELKSMGQKARDYKDQIDSMVAQKLLQNFLENKKKI